MTDDHPPARQADSPDAEARHGSAVPDAIGDPTAPEPQQAAPKPPPRTRTSIAFSGFVAGAIVLILLLVFILENTKSVKISYFGATAHVALGVALLLAAVGGALLVGLLGAARIAQVRRHARRHGRPRRR